jgi:hypothetical protein
MPAESTHNDDQQIRGRLDDGHVLIIRKQIVKHAGHPATQPRLAWDPCVLEDVAPNIVFAAFGCGNNRGVFGAERDRRLTI